MALWSFPDLETLRRALTQSGIPRTMTTSSLRYDIAEDGQIWLEPSAAISKANATALTKQGAKQHARIKRDLPHEACCWPAVLPLQAVTSNIGPALLEVPASALVSTFTEISRLTGAAPAWLLWDDRAFIRTAKLPYYTSMSASLGDSCRVYFEQSPGVWVEQGYRHPLTELPSISDSIALLRAPNLWQLLPKQPFNDARAIIDITAKSMEAKDVNARPVVRVSPKLVPATQDNSPELWILEADGLDRLHAWLRQADDRLVARLMFAQVQFGDRSAIVLTGRPGAASPPIVVFDCSAYRSYLRLPNLFVPVGFTLRPALRRDAARRHYAPDAAHIVCLSAEEKGIVPWQFPRTALRPLYEWVRYQVPAAVRHEPIPMADRRRVDPFVVRARRQPERASAIASAPPVVSIRWQGASWLPEAGEGIDSQQDADAAFACLQIVWDQSVPDPLAVLNWLQAESSVIGARGNADDLMTWLNDQPSAQTMRAMAAFIVRGSVEPTPAPILSRNLGAIRERLVRCSDMLPIQAAWLAEMAVHRLGGISTQELTKSGEKLMRRQVIAKRDQPKSLGDAKPIDFAGRIRADIKATK